MDHDIFLRRGKALAETILAAAHRAEFYLDAQTAWNALWLWRKSYPERDDPTNFELAAITHTAIGSISSGLIALEELNYLTMFHNPHKVGSRVIRFEPLEAQPGFPL